MPQISCPHCRQPYEIPPEQWPQYQGRRITCTRCNQPFDVAGAVAPPTAPPVPPQAYPGAAPAGPTASLAGYGQYGPPGMVRPKQGMSGGMIALLVCGIALVLIVVGGGIVAAIVLPRFTARSNEAKVASAKADLSIFQGALELYEQDNGRYPTTEEGLKALRVRPADGQSWHGPYLAKDAGNDPWGNPYLYSCPGTHNPNGFDVFSTGPDGHEGGGDDIGNW